MTQALKTLLNTHPAFQAILAKADLLNTLQGQFARAAPPYLVQCSHVTGLELGTLSLATSNATAAAKLRQLAPEIVNQLKNQGAEVSGLRIKVQVSYLVAPPPPPPRLLSAHAQRAIKQLEATLGDTPLKAALHKLIR